MPAFRKAFLNCRRRILAAIRGWPSSSVTGILRLATTSMDNSFPSKALTRAPTTTPLIEGSHSAATTMSSSQASTKPMSSDFFCNTRGCQEKDNSSSNRRKWYSRTRPKPSCTAIWRSDKFGRPCIGLLKTSLAGKCSRSASKTLSQGKLPMSFSVRHAACPKGCTHSAINSYPSQTPALKARLPSGADCNTRGSPKPPLNCNSEGWSLESDTAVTPTLDKLWLLVGLAAAPARSWCAKESAKASGNLLTFASCKSTTSATAPFAHCCKRLKPAMYAIPSSASLVTAAASFCGVSQRRRAQHPDGKQRAFARAASVAARSFIDIDEA
mmetsp:Transcript_54747/g.128064  ORF Transcript_54747/g.128064 Transcript_54747/m.128064 type:complete len:327 (-) Transcript_54747:432-1412(-)